MRQDDSKSCLSYWYPILQSTKVRTPKTAILRAPDSYEDLLNVFDGKDSPTLPILTSMIERAIEETGLRYPVFLRTGSTSGKHDWKNTCFLQDAASIGRHIIALIEYGEMAALIGPPFDVWVVREMLETDPKFYAFSGKMPITKERRYFFKDGKIVSHAPYWPNEAFLNHADISSERWLEILEEMNTEDMRETTALRVMTEHVAAAFEGAWSLDWLWTKRGWYAIDMALAETSYGCPPELQNDATA
jgi:hypothetical protein